MAMFINDRPMQKVLLKNTTRMSLHERFTYLRSASGEGSNPALRQRELQQQTARNRRLALQMERRPAVMAALKLKKRSLRQRLGLAGAGVGVAADVRGAASRAGFGSIKDRLTLGRQGRRSLGRGGARLGQQQQLTTQRRGRTRGAGGSRPNARGRLKHLVMMMEEMKFSDWLCVECAPLFLGVLYGRSQSMQSLNNANKPFARARSRSRSRSRVRANSISNNNLNNNNQMRFGNKLQNRGGGGLGRGLTRGGNGLRFNQRGRLGARGGRGTGFRGRRIGNNWGSGRGRRGGGDLRGRGGIRGRGGRGRGRGAGRTGRGRRGGGGGPTPTKEELDSQLDQYMANTRYSLDKDLDTYMKEANTLGTSSAGVSGGGQDEAWD